MKIENYPLSLFNDVKVSENGVHTIAVPKGSKFLGVKVIHDGVYCWYAIPELEVQDTIEEKFIIMKPDQSIPDNAEFITIVDTVIEVEQKEGPPQQALLVLPIFKIKE